MPAAVTLAEEIFTSITTTLTSNFTFNVGYTNGTGGFQQGQTIGLGRDHRGGQTSFFWYNNSLQRKSTLGIILVHEILHGLGMSLGAYNSNQIQVAYQQMTNVLVISETTYTRACPIENDGGIGSENIHFEEGSGVTDFANNVPNNAYVYRNEIMTPVLNQVNFITPMTIGALQGLGHVVNYASNHVFNPISTGINAQIGKANPNNLAQTRLVDTTTGGLVRQFIVQLNGANLPDAQLNFAT